MRAPASIFLMTLGVALGAPLGARAQDSGTLAYEVPSGWRRTTNPANGLTFLTPGGLQPGRVCVLTVAPPQRSTATAQTFHDEMVRHATANATLLAAPEHDSIGVFRVTTVFQRAPDGSSLWVRIYTVRWGDSGQLLMLMANAPEVARSYMPVVDEVLGRVALPRAASARAPSPGSSMGAMVAGLYSYTTFRYDVMNNLVPDQYWYLFSPEGRVCRGYTVPKVRVGADWHQFDFNSDPANCGTFEVRGTEVVMNIGRSPETIVFQVPDRNGKMTIQRATYSLWKRW